MKHIASLAVALVLASSVAALGSGCTKVSSTSQTADARVSDSALTPAPATTNAPVAPGFVNRIWQAVDSSDVEIGSMYAFLSDGTLVMTSPHGKPSLGEWKLSPAGLTMVEESISYETDITALTPKEFHLRSRNPGGTAEIRLVPADTPPYTP